MTLALPSTLDLPPFGPVDEFTRARLRGLIVERFGDFATLDLHLDLLDSRGAWYAERAMGSWSAQQPDSFFGVVRHVIRTQAPGTAPSPDIEGWLEAGRPTHDPILSELWDHVNQLARQGGFDVLDHDRGSGPSETPEAVIVVDEALTNWPEEQQATFLRTYVNLEIVLRRRNIVLPPIGT